MDRNDVTWHGCLAVLVTPFTADGKIDQQAWKQLVEMVVQDGAHGIITCGSSGEFYVMEPEEQRLMYRLTVEQVRHRVPVIAGTSGISAEDVVRLGQYAADCGVDGTMILPPYYAMPNEREIIAFFQEISDRVPLPILLYNGTRRTGVNLVPRIVARLADIPHVVAIKDSSKDFLQVCDLIHKVGDRVRIFTGFETMLLATVAMGGDGAVAMAPQAMGRIPMACYEAAVRGDLVTARALQRKITRFYDVFTIGNFYSGLKEAVNQAGRPGGYPRKPLLPLTDAEKAQIRTIMQELDLLGK